ncbi:MAG: amidohydrolase [Ruminococcaceae bacterium]|nr:amidohydrolase [Oscillospiraceae bacterium]
MENIIRAVEAKREMILEAERYIWKNPETGYKEIKTSAYMAQKFSELGYELTMAEGITGFYTVVDTGREGPEVLVLAELDSIICPAHPDADKETGAVHSCGHNAQCAAMLGIAAALKDEAVLASLSGRIRLCVVPAEELLEIEYRKELVKQGKIKYLGGKSEFLYRGYFDGVDMAFMVHTAGGFAVKSNSNGCIAKSIIYKGVAAHAGGSPDQGRNALYAATCGLNAINAIRETFRDQDHVRVHPIITHGGDMVNAIPETVTLESYVRGKTFEAIAQNNAKVNRALCGAALSVGTNIEIIDIPGYSPLTNDMGMMCVARDAAKLCMPERDFFFGEGLTDTGSTDMGDLSCIMPVVHPYCPGARGKGHGNDYEIHDPELACIKSAEWQLAMLKLLLGDGAARAKEIISEFKPRFASKEEFLKYQDALNCSGDRINYLDGKAEVRL